MTKELLPPCTLALVADERPEANFLTSIDRIAVMPVSVTCGRPMLPRCLEMGTPD